MHEHHIIMTDSQLAVLYFEIGTGDATTAAKMSTWTHPVFVKRATAINKTPGYSKVVLVAPVDYDLKRWKNDYLDVLEEIRELAKESN